MLAYNAHNLQVVALTSKCGESSSPVTQLQVVKALLTYATGVCGQTQEIPPCMLGHRWRAPSVWPQAHLSHLS